MRIPAAKADQIAASLQKELTAFIAGPPENTASSNIAAGQNEANLALANFMSTHPGVEEKVS